jgi:hypothetical protein
MLEVECTRCGRKVCERDVEWLEEIPHCERCYSLLTEDKQIEEQNANASD